MTILVIGGTGTLGRQIVRQVIDAGYITRCLVRNIRKADFLRDWGSDLVYGDLKIPETIPNALNGITIIIDAATLRAEDEIAKLSEVDLIGKIALIKAARVANIDKFIFFSITKNEKFKLIPLLKLKNKVEKILQYSKIPYKIYQLSGFYQGIINQYAIPILEQQTIYTTKDSQENAYIDTQDIAKICVKLLISDSKSRTGDIIECNGPKIWTANTIIKLCEEIPGQIAKISYTPKIFLTIVKKIISFAKWGWDIEDRLSFVELLSSDTKYNSKYKSDLELDTNKIIYREDLVFLENYLQEYFETMLKKLKDLNYDRAKATKRKDLQF